MKIKRFLAPDIRQALQQVKETLGAEAVILSNRKTEQGVEIIATCDFDLETVVPPKSTPQPPEASEVASNKPPTSRPESEAKPPPKPEVVPRPAFSARSYSTVAEFAGKPKTEVKKPRPSAPIVKPTQAPAAAVTSEPQRSDALASLRQELQEMRRLLDRHLSQQNRRDVMRDSPIRLDLLRVLNELGFARRLALALAQQVGAYQDFGNALRQVRQRLTEQISVYDADLDSGGIVALVGPTGVGKTTTIAKLAAGFRLKHGPRQIALVTTDNYRIAACEQLGTYARILGVPMRVASDPEELKVILHSLLDRRLILIDTAGMSPRDVRLAEQFDLLRNSGIAITTYLVLAASTQLHSLYEAIEAFSGCQPKAAILTKLDEAGRLGPALSALIERELGIAFFTDGQQVPEDLHLARSEVLIQRCFDAELVSKAVEAEFDLEDWITHASA